MKLSSYKIFLIIFFVIGITLVLVLLFGQNLLFYKNTVNQNISILKASYDINKISDQKTQNYIKNSKNISIQLLNYTIDPSRFPIEYVTKSGKYEYNITFISDGLNIIFAPDSVLSSNQAQIDKILTQLIIASSQQKFEKQLSVGSLFDKNIREDHINYMNKVMSNSTINKSVIVTLKP